MTLDFTEKRIAMVSMIDYVTNIITTWDKIVKQGSQLVKRNAAPDNSFKVNVDSLKLEPL